MSTANNAQASIDINIGFRNNKKENVVLLLKIWLFNVISAQGTFYTACN